MAPAQASLLAKLDTQERVRDFLTNAVASGRASHAYLFLGAPGAGKLDAAWALDLQEACRTRRNTETLPLLSPHFNAIRRLYQASKIPHHKLR